MPGDIFIWIGVVSLLGLSTLLLILIFGLSNRSHVLDATIEYRDIALLIPFRNENKVGKQLKDLRELFSGVEIKIFWIDDFSDDIPVDFLKEVEAEPNFKLIRRISGKAGKKEAITFGMHQINAEWILLIDVDSRPQPNFFSKGFISVDSKWKMVLLPLVPAPSGHSFRIFFDLEFLVLQLVTHASAILGFPLLANGAAMLVKKAEYLESLKVRRDFHIASGDDVFALFAFQSKFGRKSIGTAANAIKPFKVTFPQSLRALWQQRLRWVSKTGQVPNIWYLSVSILVLLANLSVIPLIGYFLCNPKWGVIVWSILAYSISSVSFLFLAVYFANRWRLTPYIIPAIIVYPFYLSALLLAAIVVKPKWK